METLFLLLAAHALLDYPLQGDFLAKAKHPLDREVSAYMGKGFWVHALTSHALIQGGGVAVVTGIWWLGLFETIAHWIIDYGKCMWRYSIHVDQFLHVLCKVVWTLIAISNVN